MGPGPDTRRGLADPHLGDLGDGLTAAANGSLMAASSSVTPSGTR